MDTKTEWVLARLTKQRAELLLAKLRTQAARPVKNKTQERLHAEWVEQIKALEEALGIEHWPRTIHFNTGRMYGDKGQRITATAHDDVNEHGRRVSFKDHDRHIAGEFRFKYGRFSPELVMRKYDGSTALPGGGYEPHYAYTTQADRDAYQGGGCNVVYDESAETRHRL